MFPYRSLVAERCATVALSSRPVNEPRHHLEGSPKRNYNMVLGKQPIQTVEGERVTPVDSWQTYVPPNAGTPFSLIVLVS